MVLVIFIWVKGLVPFGAHEPRPRGQDEAKVETRKRKPQTR